MRVESLTFFRFLAAIIVVCFHFGKETSIPEWLGSIAVSGAEMVTFFFVLSGFVMMISHYHKQNQPVLDYYVSRFARVVPVYLLALAPFVLVYSDKLGFILSITFTQAWFSPYPLKPNVPAWSLSVEMFFYLLFPWLLYWVKRYRINAATLLSLALIVYGLTQLVLSRLIQPAIYQSNPSTIHDLIFFFPPSHLCSFLLGLAAGKLYLENKAFFNNQGLFQWLFCFSMLLMTYFALNNQQYIIDFLTFSPVLGASFLAPLFMLLVLGIVSSDNVLTRLLARPGFIFLGEISFGIYIMQLPVEALCNIVFPEALQADETQYFLAYLLVLIVISTIVYRFFEIPCKRYLLRYYRMHSNVAKPGVFPRQLAR